MTTAPDFMPVLSHGSHEDPSQGACVMEYVSILAGEEFTDCPSCTHPVLASIAIRVNDSLSDRDRHLLVPLIPRLFGTGASSVTVYQLHDWATAQRKSNTWTIADYVAGAYEPAERIARFTDLLDHFDELAGRATSAPLSPEDTARLVAATR